MSECSPEEHARALVDRSNFACLSRWDAIGLTVVVGAGLLSLLAILYVFSIIVHHVRWRMKNHPTASRKIFMQPMDILMASLLIADILQAIGAVLSLKWIQAGKVEVGPFCTSQGILKIIGATGVAFSTLTIAIYTFIGVWANKTIKSMKVTLAIVVTLWTVIAILLAMAITLNHRPNFNFMGPSPYWCWINRYEVRNVWKAAVEYMWLWLTLAVSLLIYIPICLWMSGNLVIDENVWWKSYLTLSAIANQENRALRRQSLTMLAYPAVNFVCILTVSATRWKSYIQGHSTVPPAATFAAFSLFALSGFFNAVLLLKTRPSSGLFGHLMFRLPVRPPLNVEQRDDVERTDMGRAPPEIIAARG